MIFGLSTRHLLGLVLLQVAVFQWALWSFEGGHAEAVLIAAALLVGLVGAGVSFVLAGRRRQYERSQP